LAHDMVEVVVLAYVFWEHEAKNLEVSWYIFLCD
jgi:hypothetical protein